jgi:glycosyltransferase involved in cell wall biosynthesis
MNHHPAPQRLRIVHVIDGIDVGGAEVVLAGLVEQLQDSGHQNTVIALTGIGALGDRFAVAGAITLALGFPRGRLPLAGTWRLVKAVRRAEADIIQGWMYHGNLAATVARWLAGCRAPLAWSIHNTLVPPVPMRARTRGAFRLGAAFSWKPRAIVYVSAASASQHEQVGFRHERSIVIPNGIDCGLFRPRQDAAGRLRIALGLAPSTSLVGWFARWDPMKGHSTLFNAARRLIDEGFDLHLVLAGSGIDSRNAELGHSLRDAGMVGHVSLLGVCHDMAELVAGLDLFVLPSHSEAFPLALVEAMASAVPCVTTNTGDCAWIVGDGDRVAPPGDPDALAACMRRLLTASSGERARVGAADRNRVVYNFSLSNMTTHYSELYVELAGGGRRALASAYCGP